jgi:hypothetical protein
MPNDPANVCLLELQVQEGKTMSISTDLQVRVRPGTKRWDELLQEDVTRAASLNWCRGDAALEIAPMGDEDAMADLAEYADKIGIPANTMRSYRQVASAWPKDNRLSSVSWKVHQTFMKDPDLLIATVKAEGSITVARAREILDKPAPGRKEPKKSPADKAKDALTDKEARAIVMADPAVKAQIAAMARDQAAADVAAQAEAAATQSLADAKAEAARQAELGDAPDDVEDGLQEAVDEAARKIAALQTALNQAQDDVARLERSTSADRKRVSDAEKKAAEVSRWRTEELEKLRKAEAELAEFRKDPERNAAARENLQYQWINEKLLRANAPLSEVDTKLGVEASVLTGERREAMIQTIDGMSMRLVSIRAKFGDWNTEDL